MVSILSVHRIARNSLFLLNSALFFFSLGFSWETFPIFSNLLWYIYILFKFRVGYCVFFVGWLVTLLLHHTSLWNSTSIFDHFPPLWQLVVASYILSREIVVCFQVLAGCFLACEVKISLSLFMLLKSLQYLFFVIYVLFMWCVKFRCPMPSVVMLEGL